MTFTGKLKLHDGKAASDYTFEPGVKASIAVRSYARGLDLEIVTPAEDLGPYAVNIDLTDPAGKVTQTSSETITPTAAGTFTYRKRISNLTVAGVYTLDVLLESGASSAPAAIAQAGGNKSAKQPALPAPVAAEPAPQPAPPVINAAEAPLSKDDTISG